MLSFLMKQYSSEADTEDTITGALEPNLRETIGPYCRERICNDFLQWWFRQKLLLRWNTSLIARKVVRRKARFSSCRMHA